MKSLLFIILCFYLWSLTEEKDCFICPEDIDVSDPHVQKIILDKHNMLRRLADATNMLKMEWNDECSKKAQIWANTCPWNHDKYDNRSTSEFKICGQNMLNIEGDLATWPEVIQAWYNEIENFTYDRVAYPGVLHFTQVMWATTFQVGCAWKNCSSFIVYICNYCPGGNLKTHAIRPFRKGKPCEECKGHCENKLCTNPCYHEDIYGDCYQLVKLDILKACEDVDGSLGCNATCKCGRNIHFVPSLFTPEIASRFEALTNRTD